LPTENWADLLPFVPRRQLVEIVKQLGDRQFAKILQFFLTEVGSAYHFSLFPYIIHYFENAVFRQRRGFDLKIWFLQISFDSIRKF
jgi:hypothetical protein